jgi:4-hydroxyproline epimerase
MTTAKRLEIVDSHTAGEPTRVVIGGGPDLGIGTVAERAERLKANHDWLRKSVILEPRGSDVLVGALLVAPHDPSCQFGVIFFNNVGYLNMCGHGTIGLVTTLAHLGRVTPGYVRIETVVGIVTAKLRDDGNVAMENVPSYRFRKGISLLVPLIGPVTGDVAWGGNWFFLTSDTGVALVPENIEKLTERSWAIRQGLESQGIIGERGGVIDHIEFYKELAQSCGRNFVLCPGKAYDRSPCGTGTSAKVACLAADGKLAPGEIWTQESIIGSSFEASYRFEGKSIIPTIIGHAHITGEGTLLLSRDDPFREGISLR